jgi:hypothetical protein
VSFHTNLTNKKKIAASVMMSMIHILTSQISVWSDLEFPDLCLPGIIEQVPLLSIVHKSTIVLFCVTVNGIFSGKLLTVKLFHNVFYPTVGWENILTYPGKGESTIYGGPAINYWASSNLNDKVIG